MLGAVIVALVIVVALPVGLMVSGAVAAVALGWTLKEDGDTRHEGSELVDLYK
jgi:hypothetical protein